MPTRGTDAGEGAAHPTHSIVTSRLSPCHDYFFALPLPPLVAAVAPPPLPLPLPLPAPAVDPCPLLPPTFT
ncbi:hypothetical protein E2C01_018566 [Portunus trituberculatus]|uniref:Uncharacterized protein n=1 Tax=Portunus trituberculatus TaxID=210409 RepID=A0A5B7DUU6_PORTR|nr:hypothetical protein [Portunus trituberculatus]